MVGSATVERCIRVEVEQGQAPLHDSKPSLSTTFVREGRNTATAFQRYCCRTPHRDDHHIPRRNPRELARLSERARPESREGHGGLVAQAADLVRMVRLGNRDRVEVGLAADLGVLPDDLAW